jgi:hypothetical protein
VVVVLKFGMKNDPFAGAYPHHGDIVGKHHGGRGLGAKGLDIGFDASGNHAEQAEEERRRFVHEGLQDPIEGLVDAGV